MVTTWRRLVGAALVVVGLLAGLPLAAQPTLQASVDRPVVRNNESFTYVVRAQGLARGEPEEAPLAADFDVLQRSSSSRVQIMNGQTSQVTEWQFQLMPKATGTFTIPALRVGDRQTNPVEVRVLEPEAGDNATADIFIELEAAPSTVYVQSQVLFTLRLFIGVSTGRATLTAPEITGGEAIIERLGEDSQYQSQRGGRNYIVRERRYAIFPQSPGPLTIGPATFEAMVIPDRGFSRVQRFRSDVLELDVQRAVAPPPGLSGAAWLPAKSVTLSEEWSDGSDELAVGIPRTRTIVIEAVGLLETQLPEIAIPPRGSVRQYADQPELAREVTPDGLSSRRSVRYAVIAQSPGEATLSGVRLPWWNVSTGEWEVAELPPRTLRIAPSSEAPARADAPASTATAFTATPTRSGYWPWLAAALALAWAVTAALLWRSREAMRHGAGAPKPAKPVVAERRLPSLRTILRDLDSACAANDAAAARRALGLFAEVRFPSSPPRSLGALAARLPEAVAREILDLEAHIYGAASGAWDGDALKSLLRDLEHTTEVAQSAAGEPLLPLYR